MKTKVGLAQVVLVMLIGRILVVFTGAVSGGYTEADMLSVLLGLPVVALMGIPILLFCKKHGQSIGLLEGAECLGKPVGKMISMIYAAYFFLVGVIGVGKFDFFFGHIMPRMPQNLSVAVIILVPTLYAVLKGLEAILRAGSILAVVCLAALAVTVGALVPRMEIANLVSPYLSDWNRVIFGVLNFAAQTPEIVALGVLAPYLQGSAKHGYHVFIFSSTAAIFTMVTVTIAVLGSYGVVTKFPFYTATGVFQLGSFQNLDALQIAVWTLGGFLKSSFFLWLCRHCLAKVFPIFQKLLPTCVLILAAALCAAFYSGNESRLPLGVTAIAAAAVVVVIPVVLLFAQRKRPKEGAAA